MQTSYTFELHAELIPGFISTILTALPMTVYLLAYSLLFGLVIGLLLTFAQLRGGRVLASLAHGYISLMRGVPSLVLIFLLFMGLPQVMPVLAKLPKSTFILAAMTLISSANLGEMMRSSYLAVEHGQTEAALSVGMTEVQALRRIVLPQAVAIAVPNLGNNVISIFKETALAFSIGTLDLMGRAQTISQASYGASRLEVYISAAIIYWGICLLLQLVTTIIERATSRGRTVTA
ncbi:amino acid ABC transporter permease [uncultured Parolsenella sp.]|uniref:amino acid ABC transporter permease n=1 Tax=uncultured Parolsenella sp. TaxID=2083008 RepID=UPI0025EB0AEA|nr:amino acid ABC transporter permease [uncultured Parolsenella sp.]